MPFPTWLSRSEEADLLLQEAVGGGGNVLPETADQATWLKPPGAGVLMDMQKIGFDGISCAWAI